MPRSFSVLLSCVLVLAGSTAARAQDSSWGDIAVSAANVDFDLSGTGNTPGLAVRATRDLTPHLALEVRTLFAKPEQQFGPSTLIVPEAQLQYRWNMARFTPYVGGGGGAAVVNSDFQTDWEPTLSVAAGTRFRLTDHMGLIGEFRLRGIEWQFVGSTAEWSAGLTWDLPAF